MVFHLRQIGKLKLFNRKKPAGTSQENLGSENKVAENLLSSNLDNQGIALGISGAEMQAPIKNVTVLENYPLNAPYAYVNVTRDVVRGNIAYTVEEPTLNKTDVTSLQRLKGILNEVLQLKPMELKSKHAAGEYLVKKCNEVLDNYRFNLDPDTRGKLLYYVVRDNLGYGKIDPLMRDPLIEDVSCDGINVPLYIWHRKFESIPTNIRFETADELDTNVLRLAYLCGSHVSIAQPLLDASLPEGSRINLTYGSEVTRKGSTFTIRKFKLDPFTVTDLVSFNSLSPEMAAFFWYAVENRVSILVAGGIAAGKTTLLNCLSMFIKPDLKVVSIEDTPELNLPHENWIPAATRTHFGLSTENADITLFDLLKASLRQRPDYIIVGEIRGAEAYTLFQAVSTGHLGMSTVHAESVESTVYRLESAPMNIPRTLIAGIDIILVQKRVEIGGKPVRKTVSTSEIVGLDPRSGEILTNEVYKWNPAEDTFDFTGRSYILEKIAEKTGITTEQASEEIQRRAKVIQWMVKNNVRNYKGVSNIVRSYLENPEPILAEALKNE
ncbi:MAG: type II/IV secretion system ATPase subunit [Candidatus Bathyarchaeota archaeon]|nr:type II/IV secretion system ATPase subunit [Candidatus Bathyarchaeota archaeon]